VKAVSWARRRCVERAGEFFSRSGFHLFGVLNIAGAAVIPFNKCGNVSGIKSTLGEAITAY
jgi:hypothetical protein